MYYEECSVSNIDQLGTAILMSMKLNIRSWQVKISKKEMILVVY